MQERKITQNPCAFSGGTLLVLGLQYGILTLGPAENVASRLMATISYSQPPSSCACANVMMCERRQQCEIAVKGFRETRVETAQPPCTLVIHS